MPIGVARCGLSRRIANSPLHRLRPVVFNEEMHIDAAVWDDLIPRLFKIASLILWPDRFAPW